MENESGTTTSGGLAELLTTYEEVELTEEEYQEESKAIKETLGEELGEIFEPCRVRTYVEYEKNIDKVVQAYSDYEQLDLTDDEAAAFAEYLLENEFEQQMEEDYEQALATLDDHFDDFEEEVDAGFDELRKQLDEEEEYDDLAVDFETIPDPDSDPLERLLMWSNVSSVVEAAQEELASATDDYIGQCIDRYLEKKMTGSPYPIVVRGQADIFRNSLHADSSLFVEWLQDNIGYKTAVDELAHVANLDKNGKYSEWREAVDRLFDVVETTVEPQEGMIYDPRATNKIPGFIDRIIDAFMENAAWDAIPFWDYLEYTPQLVAEWFVDPNGYEIGVDQVYSIDTGEIFIPGGALPSEIKHMIEESAYTCWLPEYSPRYEVRRLPEVGEIVERLESDPYIATEMLDFPYGIATDFRTLAFPDKVEDTYELAIITARSLIGTGLRDMLMEQIVEADPVEAVASAIVYALKTQPYVKRPIYVAKKVSSWLFGKFAKAVNPSIGGERQEQEKSFIRQVREGDVSLWGAVMGYDEETQAAYNKEKRERLNAKAARYAARAARYSS